MTQREPPAGDASSRPSVPGAIEPNPSDGLPAGSSTAARTGPIGRAPGVGLHRHRPSAVTVVAVTYLLLSVAWVAVTVQALIAAQILLPPGGGLLDTALLRSHMDLVGAIVAVRQWAAGVTAFVAGVALLRMHPRGWLLGMIAAVIVLAVQLVSWYDATPNYALMAITVVIVLLMNQAEVRDAFGDQAMA